MNNINDTIQHYQLFFSLANKKERQFQSCSANKRVGTADHNVRVNKELVTPEVNEQQCKLPPKMIQVEQ